MNHNYIKVTTKQIILLFFITNISYAQGYISETIQHDGLIREFSIYVPASYDGTTNFLYYLIYMEGGTIAFHIGISDMSPTLIRQTLLLFILRPPRPK